MKVKPHTSPPGCSIPTGGQPEEIGWGPRSPGDVTPQPLLVSIDQPEPCARRAHSEPGPVQGGGRELMLGNHVTWQEPTWLWLGHPLNNFVRNMALSSVYT